MTRGILVAAIAVLVVASGQATQSTKDEAERLLKAAQNTEVVDGQPAEAIKQYQAIIARFGTTDRSVAAIAMLRMADCYSKLGADQAAKTYQRVITEYADQSGAVMQARSRLAALARPQAGGTVPRRVWAGPSRMFQYGGISRDGRWLLYTYNSGPDSEADKWGLHIRDLSSGTSRKLVASTFLKNREQVDYRAALSRDNRLVAYIWQGAGGLQLRTVSVTKPSESPRVLVDSEDIRWIAPHDWTPDGKLIAVDLIRKDGTAQIGLVSSGDGQLRVLKSVNWDDAGAMRFSPDGKYLAFGQMSPEDRTSDIYVLATDATREVPTVVHKGSDSLLGWSADGRQLLFLSDRTGSFGIWSQEFAGQPVGTARLIRADTGRLDGIGLTAAGDLYYAVGPPPSSQSNLKSAALDLAAGRVLSMPVVAVQEHVGSNDTARWSPDGKQWAYISRRQPDPVIVIRAAEDNRVIRELQSPLHRADRGTLAWAPDGQSLSVLGAVDRRPGIYRIDAQTGQPTPIVVSRSDSTIGRGHEWSPDGRTLYFLRLGESAGPATPSAGPPSRPFTLVAFDVNSNTETEVMRATHAVTYGTNFAISPDGRTVYYTRPVVGQEIRVNAVVARDIRSGVERVLWEGAYRDGDLRLSPDGRYIVRNAFPDTSQWTLIPTDGGTPRRLPGPGAPQMWSADSRAILFTARNQPAARIETVDGTAATTLAMGLEGGNGEFVLHPDGRRVLFLQTLTAGDANPGSRPPSEVWVLERLVPRLPSTTK